MPSVVVAHRQQCAIFSNACMRAHCYWLQARCHWCDQLAPSKSLVQQTVTVPSADSWWDQCLEHRHHHILHTSTKLDRKVFAGQTARLLNWSRLYETVSNWQLICSNWTLTMFTVQFSTTVCVLSHYTGWHITSATISFCCLHTCTENFCNISTVSKTLIKMSTLCCNNWSQSFL